MNIKEVTHRQLTCFTEVGISMQFKCSVVVESVFVQPVHVFKTHILCKPTLSSFFQLVVDVMFTTFHISCKSVMKGWHLALDAMAKQKQHYLLSAADDKASPSKTSKIKPQTKRKASTWCTFFVCNIERNFDMENT